MLVATDFSEPSIRALARARVLARQTSADLLVVHVLEHVLALDDLGGEPRPDVSSVNVSLEASARRQLEGIVDEPDRRDLNARTLLVKASSAAHGILTAAADTQAELVVVGTHGRTGLSHLFGGSVAEAVVRRAPCSVLVVRDRSHSPTTTTTTTTTKAG